MKKSDALNIILGWQNQLMKTEGIERVYEEFLLGAMNSKPVKIVTGFRRSGKSFLVQRIAKKMIDRGDIQLKNVCYLNFEDFQLVSINTPEKLDQLVKVFMTDIANDNKKLFIFDEIQHVKNWDKYVRTVYERNDPVEMIITGSNSELLSSELGSNLAGRFIELSILPFDFKEFLKYRGIEISSSIEFVRQHEEIERHFAKYIKYGGMPETFSISSEDACYSYLEGILSKVILDDIIDRFQIRNVIAIERTLKYLYAAVGNNISFRRIGSFLKQLGINIKTDTLINYVRYMLGAFALYEINKFDWKLGRFFSTSRKYYSVDTGLINTGGQIPRNYSKQLENIVFLKLKQANRRIYFGELSNGKEIDFIVQENTGTLTKYQVTQALHDHNFDRELAPFTVGDAFMKKGENILLSLEMNEGQITYKETKIKRINLIKWLLDCQI